MKSIGLSLTLFLAAIGFLAGCSDPVSPSGVGVPTGTYRYETSFTEGGVDLRRVSTMMLLSQREGYIFDTLYRNNAGTWQPDSTVMLELAFRGFGNGYYRTIGIQRRGSSQPDTSVSYWLFARRADSVYMHVGQSYEGNNLGIVGRWDTPEDDTALLGGRYSLHFRNDSVAIEGNDPVMGPLTGVFRYQTDRDSLRIIGAPVDLGNRYSVTPGWWLYLTHRPTHGYGKVEGF